MASPTSVITARLADAMRRVAPEVESPDPLVRPSDRADFQANGVLPLAKRLGRRPQELAEELVAAADLDDVCASVEVSGPGFLNLTLRDEFVAAQAASLHGDARLGVPLPAARDVAVVDYSAPNVAKEMHVGHLRSTIIGDAIVRLLTFEGDEVVRQNHLGDWGTPFGMLIEHLQDVGEDEGAHLLSVGDLNDFYREARKKFDADDAFAERSRQRVVALQAGDEVSRRLWHVLVEQSTRYFSTAYDRLAVTLTPGDNAGESSYNDVLQDVVDELTEKGLVVESDGALCLFPPGFTNRNGEPLPLIVRKSDGGFGYAATDLAALRHRLRDLGAALVAYVVGLPQREHLEMVFEAGRMAGWFGPGARAVHVAFGSVLGSDRKMLRTRAGASVKLVDLLDEAVERAAAVVTEKNPDLDEEPRAAIARAVGIGAVKYADLSNDRLKDYVFDFDRMLAFEGNTGPYLQYAHARIRSIFRRGEVTLAPDAAAGLALATPAERALALRLLAFPDVVRVTVDTFEPHRLCVYLFELAGAFTSFYEACPVLREEEPTRTHRLVLCDLTSRTLATGLGLLGIEAPEAI